MTEKQGFWTSLPGILTGLAAFITALTGLYVAVFNFNPTSNDNKISHPDIFEPADNTPTSDTGDTNGEYSDPRLLTSGQITANQTTEEKTKRTLTEEDFYTFPKTGLLVNCDHFPSVNSIDSLMSWSNHYHKEIIEGNEFKPTYAGNQTSGYRGRAHCMQPENSEIRQALLESLALCRKFNFEWHQVTMQ